MDKPLHSFWSVSATEMLKELESVKEGLTVNEAKNRLALHGANRLKPQKRFSGFTLLVSQFKSPIILILLLATVLSFFCTTRLTQSSYFQSF